MISILFWFGCMHRPVFIGVIDAKEDTICVIQLADESIIHVDSKLCADVKEGDVIGVIRENSR
jgi:hypothetical protein